MKRSALLCTVLLCCTATMAQDHPTQGGVTGVGGIRLLAADLGKAREFYAKTLGLAPCRSKSDAPLCFDVNPVQKIEIESLGQKTGPNRLIFIAFRADNARALRDLLSQSGVSVGDMVVREDDTKFFEILDPEGHTIRFVEFSKSLPLRMKREEQVSSRIIHVGYVVQNRVPIDHLYEDVLGFHIYWQGGMKDDKDDWVAMQAPGKHSTDWVEYMLNISPTADKHTLGVMNHIALGVPDIQAAKAQLVKNGAKLTEEPKLGRDGKWQLNLYDPDDTRVEFMEFTPKEKPCCSEFTGPHPGPHQ